MAVKYIIEYPDVQDIVNSLLIYDDDYSDAPIEVEGTVVFDSSATTNPLEPIRGHGLRVQLEANAGLKFDDLYSEDPKIFKVLYYRNSILLFQGWVNPEGWFEDFVNDKWMVSFDCVDGLYFLKDLSFVENETGLNFFGLKSQLQLLSLALLRTGLQKNINVDVQVHYLGLADTNDILANVKARAERYIKTDDWTVMSCEEVIKDILEPYGACITDYNDEWYIYKPNQLFNSSTITYYRYDYLGVSLGGNLTLDTAVALGSDVDSYALPHVNANQRISKVNSIGAFRVNYKYGKAQSLIGNYYFLTNDGTTLDDWTIDSMTNLQLATAGGTGVIFNGPLTSGTPTRIKQLSTEVTGLNQDDTFKVGFTVNCTLPVSAGWQMNWKIVIISTDSGGFGPRYARSGFTQWGSDTTPYETIKTFNGGIVNFEAQLDPLPQDGKILIELWSAETEDDGLNPPVSFDLEVSGFTLDPVEIDESIEGELHTVQRTDKAIRESDDVKEVATGDSASDLYSGTLYKADGNTPTTKWVKPGDVDNDARPILRIMGEEVLKLRSNTGTIFSGSTYGYYPLLSRVTINNVDGVFMPIEWSFDSVANTTTATLMQIFDTDLTDILYELTYDRGNVVKPTIRGKYSPTFGVPGDVTPPLQGTLNSITEI